MFNKLTLSAFLAMATLIWSAQAQAQAQYDVKTLLSEKGLEFLSKEAPSFIPDVLYPPVFGKSVGFVELTQDDTVINFNIDDLKITMPEEGRLRIETEFSGDATGTIIADDIYYFGGQATCNDAMDIDKGKAVFEYTLQVVNGKAEVVTHTSLVDIDPKEFNFSLSGCGFTGAVLNKALGFAEGWLVGYLEKAVSDLAKDTLGPKMQAMLDGFVYEGSLSLASYKASLTNLTLKNGGIDFSVDADVIDRFAPHTCVAAYDQGAPAPLVGNSPDLEALIPSQASTTVNLGLVNKGLYTFWRRGLLCLSDEHVKALGVALDISAAGSLLPGFPPGTTFSFDLSLSDYPRVQPKSSLQSQLKVELNGLILNLHGDRPDGTRNTLHVEVDMEALATVGINPTSNAIYAQLDGATISRLVMEDERKATGEGFDVARITQMVHDFILPKILSELGPIPLTGPTFAIGEYAVILRQMTTSDAYLSAGIDLFRIPSADWTDPDTQIVEYPMGITNPHDAVVRVKGIDAEIPSELLQYEVTVNDEKRPLSFVRSFKLGEAGKTEIYTVKVAAVDLNGNVDPSPAEVDVRVDGISPRVIVAGERSRKAEEGPATISWTLSDDLTESSKIAVRLEIYELVDPADALSIRLLKTVELKPGTSEATVNLQEEGGLYRVEIHGVDEAGNDTEASILMTVESSGGCSLSNGSQGTGNAGLLLFALGLLAYRRRRLR